MVELLATAVALRPHGLRRAYRIVGRAVEADMKVPVVPPPGLHLAQPRPVAAGTATESLLDRRIDEYPRDVRVLCRRLDDGEVRGRPHLGVDVLAVCGDHRRGHHLFPLDPCELVIRHRREPYVGVEAHLMTGVSRQQWATARLGHVAEEKPAPA